MSISLKGSVVTLAAAAAVLAISGSAGIASAKTAQVHCYGVNSCKGQSDCKSGAHDCKGLNSCKGQGFKAETKKKCKADGGSLTEKK